MSGAILVTGGAGFIGSHSVLELLDAGYQVVCLDNFVNAVKRDDGKAESLRRVEELSVGKAIEFVDADVRCKDSLRKVFQQHKFGSIIHFAALKAVGESVAKPLSYYNNNLIGALCLLEVAKEFGVKNFIFSSSATVYGPPQTLPLTEDHPVGQGLTNPYGVTKYFIERILEDLVKAEPEWNVIILRYFNPVGAHPSGRIGEDPKGIPNNLMPYVSQVAVGKLPFVRVYGTDYDTPDGTGVRDYIHIVDLAKGHVAALRKLMEGNIGCKVAVGKLPFVRVYGTDYDTPDGTGVRDYIHIVDLAKGHVAALRKLMEGNIGCKVYNLGTGRGYSVLEMIAALGKAAGKEIPHKTEGRREGDIASVYCDPAKAKTELGWEAKFGLQEMC